jgi:Fe-S-cluster containining protein
MSVEPFELIYLYANIRNRPDFHSILEECFRRVQAYAAFMRKQDENLPEEERENIALHQYFEAGLRCPLIAQDGGCSVHAFRPITCRMYFSFSDPRYCTPDHLLTPENRSFHLCLPDEVEEDFAEWKERFTHFALSESLYEGLLQLNSWEQDQVFP